MNFGIEKISIYLPKQCIPLKKLAEHRNWSSDILNKTGIENLAVPSKEETSVFMAFEAARMLLEECNRKNIGKLVVATESSSDLAIPISAKIHNSLQLPDDTSHYDIKFACIGGACALHDSLYWLNANRDKKVLVICTDIAKYEKGAPAEATQGAGAVAFLISNYSKIIVSQKIATFSTEDSSFQRPVGLGYAIVDGKDSIAKYKEGIWEAYSRLNLNNHKYSHIVLHSPYPKLVRKTINRILASENRQSELEQILGNSLIYPSQTGNIYTGSVFLALASLLSGSIGQDARVALIAFGSGCGAKAFDCRINLTENIVRLNMPIEKRTEIDYKTYNSLIYQ